MFVCDPLVLSEAPLVGIHFLLCCANLHVDDLESILLISEFMIKIPAQN